MDEIFNHRILEQKIGQCLKSVLLSEPRFDPLPNPLDITNPGVLVEKTFGVYPVQTIGREEPVVMMGELPIPTGMLPPMIREAMEQAQAHSAQSRVWKKLVQVLVNKKSLLEYYNSNSFPEGTMEFGKFCQSLVLLTVQSRLEKVFFPMNASGEDNFDNSTI